MQKGTKLKDVVYQKVLLTIITSSTERNFFDQPVVSDVTKAKK